MHIYIKYNTIQYNKKYPSDQMASTEREAETAVSDECRFAVAGGRGSANGKVENVECCK